jgi:hypothetical protein
MRNKALIDYLRKMMERYPGLSARKMSLDAELANNVVTLILGGKTNPTPYTIKKLTDKWGTPDDYLTMMRLAGHLPPKSDNDKLDITADEWQGMNLIRVAKGKEPIDASVMEDFWRTWSGLSFEEREKLIKIAEKLTNIEQAMATEIMEKMLRLIEARVG